MSRAPFVLNKSESAFSRDAEIFDTTIGWRFINPRMRKIFGSDSMPETGENVAEQFNVSRQDQDAFAFRSQHRWAAAQKSGFFEREIVPELKINLCPRRSRRALSVLSHVTWRPPSQQKTQPGVAMISVNLL